MLEDAYIEKYKTLLAKMPLKDRYESIITNVRSEISKLSGVNENKISANTPLATLCRLRNKKEIYARYLQPIAWRMLEMKLYDWELEKIKSIGEFALFLTREMPVPTQPASTLNIDDYLEELKISGKIIRNMRPDKHRLKGIVFLLSSSRAGSTLLQNMIAKNLQVFSPAELWLISFDNMSEREQFFDEMGVGWHNNGLMYSLLQSEKINSSEAIKRIEKLTKRNASIKEIYKYLQSRAAHRILMDKSPFNARRFHFLFKIEQLFMNSKFIFLTRHPAAVINSHVKMRIHRLFNHSNSYRINPWHLGEKNWLTFNNNIKLFLNNIEDKRVYNLHFEDLVKRPEHHMKNICDFLDIEYSERMLNPYTAVDNEYLVGDFNFFFKYKKIEPSRADVSLNGMSKYKYNDYTLRLAKNLGYNI